MLVIREIADSLGGDGEPVPKPQEVEAMIARCAARGRPATAMLFGAQAAREYGLPGSGIYVPLDSGQLLWNDLRGSSRVIDQLAEVKI